MKQKRNAVIVGKTFADPMEQLSQECGESMEDLTRIMLRNRSASDESIAETYAKTRKNKPCQK